MTNRTNRRGQRLLAVVLVAGLGLAACGGSDEPAADEPATADEPVADDSTGDDSETPDATVGEEPAEPAEAASDGLTPVPDGLDLDATVSMAYSVPPGQLDPDLSRSDSDNTYWYLAADRLTEVNNDLEIIPMLATDWEYSDDGTVFTMNLRDDVTFHDGSPFNAEAVVANITRSKGEGMRVAAALAGVESVEATGDYQVEFHLPGATPPNLPTLLAGTAGAMLSPAYLATATAESNPVDENAFSGPYHPVEWKIDESVTFERAANFWDPGRQLLAGITISFVQPDARINGVRTGEFDLGQSAATDSLQAIELGESGAFSYVPYVINTVYGAMFNPGADSVLSNQMIRQAIMYGMDRDAINAGLFEGRCDPRFQPFPAGNKYYFQDIEDQYPFDPEMAKQLVADSGIENPTFDIEVSPGSYEPFSQVMQAQLAEVGITMNIVPSETSAVPVDFIVNGAPAVYLVTLAQGDIAQVYNAWYGGTFGNLLNPEVPEAQAIRDKAAAITAAMSDDEQLEAWHEVFSDIQELAVFAPGCAAPQVWMYNPKLIGVDTMPYIWQGAVVPYTLGVLAD